MTSPPAILSAWLLILLHAPLVSGSSSISAPLFTRIGDPVSIPAEIVGHAMFVNVMVNGHGPFRFLVDTGCSVTLVSPGLAAAVGALETDQDEDFIAARNGLGDRTDVQQVALESIELGSVRFEDVPAAVSDSFAGLSAIEGRRIDGALGFPLFSDLFVGLDFPNQRMLLGRQWPAGAPAIQASLSVVEHADVPFVKIQVQGKPVEVMIDTGANQGLQLPARLVSSFQWKKEPRVGSMVAVFGEIGREQIGRLAGSIFLGGVEEVEPTAVISAGQGSLGLRSLERYCVVFHQSENRVWLCGPDAAPTMPSAERSVGLSLYPDQGGLRIAGVIPGSPAEEANLDAGALVTQIEHRPAASWTRDQIEQWINSRPAVALVVAGAAGDRALTLRVWDLVP
jgi:predicted aspartyl protease